MASNVAGETPHVDQKVHIKAEGLSSVEPRAAPSETQEAAASDLELKVSLPGNTNRPSAPSLLSSTGGKSQTVFIHKLYDMLEDSSLSHLIWWTASEDSFCLYPGEEFSNVLAQYFKHTNIASFIRQLNMYGFHKVNESFQSDDKHSAVAPPAPGQPPAPKWEFRHSANQFRKGDVDSLSLIKRKLLKLLQTHKEIVNLKSLPPTSDAPVDVDHPLGDHSHQTPTTTTGPALQQLYHRSILQLLWDQLNESSQGTPSPKLLPRQPIYAQHMAHHGTPYSHFLGPVLSMPVPFSPHSPRSPPPNEPPHGVLLPLGSILDVRTASDSMPGLAMDQAVHLKFIELTAGMNALKTNYRDLLSKYDSLYALFQRSQADLLQLTEVLEKTLAKADKAIENDDNPKLSDESIDRHKTRTPKSHLEKRIAPGERSNSPLSGKSQSQSSKLTLDLSTFRAQLLRKIGATTVRNQKSNTLLLNYHLHDSAPSIPKTSNYTIVPQHYPLNPNYGLYSSGSDVRRLVQDEAHKVMQPAPNRHVSVLMDPLQPSPAAHKDDKREREREKDKDRDRDASDLKTMPLILSATSAISGSTSSERIPGAQPPTTHTPFVQQYQPLALQANPVFYQHYQMRQEPVQMRTVSLPVVRNALTPVAAEHAPQRYSLTSIPDHRTFNAQEADSLRYTMAANASSTSTIGNHTAPTLTSNPVGGAKLPPVHVQASTGASERPIPEVLAKANTDSGTARNQLPSMQELNNSLRNGPVAPGRVYDIVSHENENAKRRKCS